MDFFKREAKNGSKEETKLVGAEVPTDLFNYLTLFCVVDRRSKTSIIRPLIEDWAKEAQTKFTEKQLIDLAAKMGYESWLNRKRKKQLFTVAIKQLQKELLKKGVSEKLVLKIIKKIEDAKSKEN